MVGRRLIGKELNNGKGWLKSFLLEAWVCVCVCVTPRRNVAQKG